MEIHEIQEMKETLCQAIGYLEDQEMDDLFVLLEVYKEVFPKGLLNMKGTSFDIHACLERVESYLKSTSPERAATPSLFI
jgi:hypothetical protein